MHPVFVEAVKKNQIGVAPQEPSFLVTTPPGTIPVTVRPPRIPELADAPVVAGVAPTPHPARRSPRRRWRLPKPAGAPPAGRKIERQQPVRQPVLVEASETKTDEEERRRDRPHGAAGRPARQRQGRQDGRSGRAAPKPKPAAKPASVASNGAIRPKPAEAEPVKTTEAQAPAQRCAAAPRRRRSAASTAMNGAAPVVPTGNFDNRWSGFR